ncbi:MAG: PD-(D/E)XK nuclease family protein, partial [Deltaproteobacteria bacterium]|nr:PD-(D/E)XK nuclease family protein [Deltaproteobacteria bacterium]
RSFAFAQDDKPRDYPPLRKKTFSISELQTYQKCPFLYYARYHLKLGERFKEETDVAPDTAGSFVHRVLEKLLKLHFDLYRDALEYDLYQNRFLQTVPPLVAAEGERDTELLKIPKPLREIFLSRVSETVIRLMKKEFAALRSGKKKTLPAHLEWMFGKGGVPPLRLKTDDGELLISGRIDRIDASDKFFTVMDYKTGECDSISKIREGESFQIPLYVMAVSSLLYPDLKPAAGLLVSLGELSKSSGFALEGSTEEECLPKGNRITSEMLENMKQDLTAKIAGIAKKIQSGAFEPDPQSESLCRFCDYRDICHYGK